MARNWDLKFSATIRWCLASIFIYGWELPKGYLMALLLPYQPHFR